MNQHGVDDADRAVPADPVDGLDDARLVTRAAAGEVGAFAVLVHRHAAGLYARTDDLDAVARAFRRAMRRLDRFDTETEDVAGWLHELLPSATRRTADHGRDDHGRHDHGRADHGPAGSSGPGAGDLGDGGDTDVAAPPLAAHELDALWAELAPRWPRGRRPFRLPRWVAQTALVVFLLSLAVLITYVAVTAVGGQDRRAEPVSEVRGVPIDDDAFDLTFEDDDATDTGDATETTP